MNAIVTAAMIVIGDEILSGRTRDRNIGHLADMLTAAGLETQSLERTLAGQCVTALAIKPRS